MIYFPLLLVLLLTGCSGLAEVVHELAADNATSCTTVTTLYGTGRIYRTNAANAEVSCSQDGMSLKSGPKPILVP